VLARWASTFCAALPRGLVDANERGRIVPVRPLFLNRMPGKHVLVWLARPIDDTDTNFRPSTECARVQTSKAVKLADLVG